MNTPQNEQAELSGAAAWENYCTGRLFHMMTPPIVGLPVRRCDLCGIIYEASECQECPRCEDERAALEEYQDLTSIRGMYVVCAVLGFLFGFYFFGGIWK